MARFPFGKWRVAIGFGIFSVVLVTVAPVYAPPAEQQTQKRTVEARDLGKDVAVIGKLGQPLGRLVTIEGRCVDGEVVDVKRFGGEPILFVDSVDGARVRDGAWLSLEPYGPARKQEVSPGFRFTLLGYETGGFVGSPTGAMEAYGTTFATISGLIFETHFEYAKVVKHAKDDLKKPYPAPRDWP